MNEDKHFFISYRRLELGFAVRLATDLKNSGFNIWLDRLEGMIRGSDDWRRAIEDAITPKHCAGLLAVISPAYITSTYCRNELARADRLNIPIIPIYLHSINEEEWPLEIERLQYINFKGREEGEGYQSAFFEVTNLLANEYPDHRSSVPDRETQYLNKLTGSLEAKRGVSDFIEPRMKVEGQEFRPRPTEVDEWGYSLLIPDTDTSDMVSKSIDRIDEVFAQTNKFLMLGEPGAGKTTIMRRLVLDVAKQRILDKPNASVPLLINLPQWSSDQSFQEFIASKWPLTDNLIQLIDDGEVSVFLDGLNEMGEDGTQKAQEIDAWVSGRAQSAIIGATCRSDDHLRGLEIANIPIVEIHELEDQQIKGFVSKYLPEDTIDGFLNQIFPQEGQVGATKSPDALIHLARNPYLLTALIFIYQNSEEGTLPQNTGILFQHLVGALWQREIERGTVSLEFEFIESSLSRLAFSMIDSGMPVDVPLSYAHFYVGNREVIRHAINSSLLIRDNGTIRFYHQLVQEYFAAIGLNRVGIDHIKFEATPSRSSHLFQASRHNKWDQAIIALCGIESNPAQIINEVALIDPKLGMRCLASGVKVSTEEVFESFYRAAQSEDDSIKTEGITALGRLGDERGISLLLEALAHPNKSVQDRASSALEEFSGKAVPALINSLETHGQDRHRQIVQTLVNIGEPSVASLISEIRTPSSKEVALGSCLALGHIGNDQAAPDIMKLLDSDDIEIVSVSIRALGELEYEPANSKLHSILDNRIDSDRIIAAIATAFGKIDDPDNIPVLIQLVGSSSWEIHSEALESLAEYSDQSNDAAKYVAMFSGLSSRSVKQRRRSVREISNDLGVIGLMHAVEHSTRSFWNVSHELVRSCSKDDFETLLAYRDSSQPDRAFHRKNVYALFANVIGSWGVSKYGKFIVDQLNHSSKFVVGLTIKAIGELGYQGAAQALIKLLEDRRPIFSNSAERICDASAIALVRIGDTAGMKAAKVWAMEEIQSRIRQDQIASLKVLAVVGDEQEVPRLKAISQYKNHRVRSAAKRALIAIEESTEEISSES